MSCPSNIPLPNFPDTGSWGPLLWCILHGLAERAGSPISPMFLEDERRQWLHFFKETGDIIPCPKCKNHYMDYLKDHPITTLKTLAHSERKQWITTWFWELHNFVNASLGKPIFPRDDVPNKYKGVNLHQTLTQLDAPIKIAIKLTGTNHIKYVEWKRRVTMMFSLFGI